MDVEIDPREAAKAYGSFNAWAVRLGVPLTTVLGWRDANSVPHWRVEKIAAVAQEDGKDIFRKARPSRKRRSA